MKSIYSVLTGMITGLRMLKFGSFFGTIVLLLAQYACFEPQSGCLDIAATNFNAAADKNCCCRYPNLVITVDQVYDTLVFRQDYLYPGTGGHLFRIKSLAFYLSEFTLLKNGVPFYMGDTVQLKIYDVAGNDTLVQPFVDDVALVRRTPLEYPIATFGEDGFFETITFRLGLSSAMGQAIPTLAPANHPLRPQPDNLYNNGYTFLQAVVVRDTMAATLPDTIRFTRADLGDFFIEGNDHFEHKLGYNFPIKLRADWSVLFQGVIWTNHDIQAWKTQMVSNFPGVFRVSM
jgi:hypothetical protein